jgi:bacterioferritin
MKTENKPTATFNIEEVIRKAKSHAEKGALLDDYPLDLQEVYKHLNAALATEIMCVLRYRHHQIIAKGIERKEIAEEFREHAENESEHMLMIAERISQLGGNPDFHPASVLKNTVTEYGTKKDLCGLIEENLIAERVVIMVYRELITFFGDKDPTTRIMLEKILKDEEEHANDLADLLEKP